MENFSDKVYPSITGETNKHWKNKIEEVKELGIKVIPLFLERFKKRQREEIYKALKGTPIEEIPLVHIRHDMNKKELELLEDKYNSQYFTIHESGFNYLNKWSGFEKNLFLEMNTDNRVPENVKVEEIGGFCVDLAHYQKQKDRDTIDYEYVYNRRKNQELFQCNHLSGYSFKKKEDLHFVKKKEDFDFIKQLPSFLFGEVIAIEIDNSIKEQLEYKKYILKLLNNR